MSETSRQKSKAFAKKIIRLYRKICEEEREYALAKQLMRSGTSIGANLAEAEVAISRADFAAKLYVALKECNETLYWLELLYETEIISSSDYEECHLECHELFRMLMAASKTLQRQGTRDNIVQK